MFNKTHKEIDDFTLGIETIKSHKKLLDYINSDFYASIKLLISISSTFSIFWKVVLPFIVSLSALLLLSNIKPIGIQLDAILNSNYILGILVCLVLFTLMYIFNSRKYCISCIEKSMSLMNKNTLNLKETK
jgi:hypothetical protein